MPINCIFGVKGAILHLLIVVQCIVLWVLANLCIWFLIRYKKFRKRASNVIITCLLVSDSFASLFSSLYRGYLNNCKSVFFEECTSAVFFTRTFTYISMALLLFFTIERYLKLVKPDIHYKVLMSKFRLWAGIGSIWVGAISFSFVTTPYWITFKVKKLLAKPRDMCVFSTIMEPLSGVITLLVSQFLAIIVVIVINCILGVRIRNIFTSVRKRLPTSSEQDVRNKEILKKVEINLFIMSNIYALLYIPSLGLSVIDIMAFLGQLDVMTYKPSESATFVLVNLAAIYPFCEAITCFFLNKDLKRLMRDFWNKSVGKISVSTT